MVFIYKVKSDGSIERGIKARIELKIITLPEKE